MVAAVALAVPGPVASQTIAGTLLDAESRQPIPLGLILMYTEAGDSVASTITDDSGRFLIASSEPGDFVLRAAALGYEEAPAGVFELGAGGEMTVEYRLSPAPLPLDALLVSVDRPVLDHHLVRNGFVRRLQRGLGKFITPHDIEQSPARSTEALMEGIPQVRVSTVVTPIGGLGIPAGFLGESVQIQGPLQSWCHPTVYVDGQRISYDPEAGFTISQLAHIDDIDAIEIYRRPAEIPVEFGVADQGIQSIDVGLRNGRGCGVLVLWTKQGTLGSRSADATPQYGDATSLPPSNVSGPPATEGETIRVQLDTETARTLGISPIWEGVYATSGARALVATDPLTGQARPLPLDRIQAIQVSRLKGKTDAIRRGAIAGAIFGVGMAAFLSTLCEFSCGRHSSEPIALPSIGVGLAVGTLVWSRGPGRQWVNIPLPPAASGPPGGVTFTIGVPHRTP